MFLFTIRAKGSGTIFKVYAPIADEAYAKVCEIYDNPLLDIDLIYESVEEVSPSENRPR